MAARHHPPRRAAVMGAPAPSALTLVIPAPSPRATGVHDVGFGAGTACGADRVAMEPSKSSPFTRASPPSSASPPPPNYLGLSSPPSRSAPGTPQRLPNPPVTWQQYRYAGFKNRRGK
ncbi:hypothetical protein O3P69_008020 [Scylla paramamosain]|uniref:Uncharacterized protein n=1 Tax=Scylla paramamosain TaxID=85552 RepID=A0AAW0T0F3_SCYPA